MKTTIKTVLLLWLFVVCFSCSKEGDDIVKNDFEPISLTINANMGLNMEGGNPESIDTKSTELEKYIYDHLYLMIPDESSPEGYKPFKVNLTDDQATREKIFEFSIVIESPQVVRIKLAGGTEDAVFPMSKAIFFSSHDRIVFNTDLDKKKLTPLGNETYKPYGKNLYRSDLFKVEYADGKIRIFDKVFDPNMEHSIKLIMCRMTGLLNVDLTLFKKSKYKEGIRPADFDVIDSDAKDWTVIPYLVNYPTQLRLDEKSIEAGKYGAYMLSDGALIFREKSVTLTTSGYNGGRPYTIETYVAGDPTYSPYIFKGPLNGATLEFLLVEKRSGGCNKGRVVKRIAVVYPPGEMASNEIKKIHVFMNIKELEGNDNLFITKSATAFDEIAADEIPDLFYVVE